MAKFIQLCLYITSILTFIDLLHTATLSVHNKEEEQSSFTNNSICCNKINYTKKEQHLNLVPCTHDHDSIKHDNIIRTNDLCSYKQRSKTTAVLISIYFGILGIDWFYLSRGNRRYIFAGICKLLISFGCCSGWPILTFEKHRLSRIMIMIGYIISTLFSLISLFWWVIDWARILANKFPDGNGFELKHFSEYF